MHKSIDAVTVSTTDHMHAPIALMAMRMGKHCFCQKPLTHTIYEARLMAKVAGEMKVATQMGNQGTAFSPLRKGGGDYQVGSARPGQRGPRLDEPADLAARRPAAGEQAGSQASEVGPVARRCPAAALCRRLSSTSPGAAGGISAPARWATWPATPSTCPTWRLNLRDPIAVQAERSGHNRDSYPKWSIITFDFPALGDRPAREAGLVRRRQAARRETDRGQADVGRAARW